MNRQLFKLKGYLPLLSAQIVSNLGDWLDILALMALIGLKWGASPIAMSAAMLCLAFPSIILGSIAGVFADRFNRKTLMICADIVRAATVLGFVFSSHLWQIYVLLILKSCFSVLFSPAESGKIKEIVPDELMQSAVATRELINNSAKIIGPILSGIFVSYVGIKWSFYLDSFSFILSAIFLLWVPGKSKIIQEAATNSDKPASGFYQQFKEGLAFIKQSPKLLIGLLLFCLVFFALQISDSQIIILLREMEGDPTNILGWLMAGSGAGIIVSSLFLGKKEIKSTFTALCFGSIGVGVVFILDGVLIHSPRLMIAILYPITGVLAGFSFGMAMMPFNIMAQKMTPAHFTGRVFGVIGSMVTTATVVGMVSGGIVSEAFGVISTFILSGSLLVLVGVIVYSFRRRLEGEKEHAESITGTP
ncbi:MAG: MFS transporter [Tuberibacillus sp.]